jgi:hypothetical protein
LGSTSNDIGRVCRPRRADLVERFAHSRGPGLMPAWAGLPGMTNLQGLNVITRMAGHGLGDCPA